uniref:natterin-3-like n=1 Tax=Euleptes europaea TaxID=460621 RepID=UPI002541B820|nr:natterin-3-like [Euleptes europaea]
MDPKSWASSMNVTLTVLKKTVQKSPPTMQVCSNGSEAAEIMNRNSRYSSRNSDAFSGTTLKWVWFGGSVPNGAVSIWNKYAKRTEYICQESGCSPGFYSPNRGSYCLYTYGGKEHKNSNFWLLVNENSFESLKWQKDSWGGIPSNSIKSSCPGYRAYVGKNKYGVGKVDPHNKAFFIGINGKEYWYKHYEALVVYKDYLSQRINNVHYMKERGSYNNQAFTLVSTRITNKNCNTVKKITSLSKTVTNERRWDFSTSLSIGVSTSMSAGIFSILEVGWSVTMEKTFSWSAGSTMSESVTFSETVEVDVPPNHTCEVTMEGQKMNGNIPFTATATREYRNGERRSATVQGVSKNSIVAHVDTYVKRCQPIPNATPCKIHPATPPCLTGQGSGCLQPAESSLPSISADTGTHSPSMSESPSQQEAPAEGQAPGAPVEEAPCAELKAAAEKCVKENGEEACKELLEAYHSCLRALGINPREVANSATPPSR